MNIIKQQLEEFEKNFPTKEQVISSSEVGWCFTKHFKEKFKQALKETIEQTIKDMLVEEREMHTLPDMGIREDLGFIRCCTLQRAKSEKIKKGLQRPL